MEHITYEDLGRSKGSTARPNPARVHGLLRDVFWTNCREPRLRR